MKIILKKNEERRLNIGHQWIFSNEIEKFEDEQPTCDFYMKHVLSCHSCRSIIMKQLNMDNDRIRNEEIMELVTYIVFGIFILLLIDILKNK